MRYGGIPGIPRRAEMDARPDSPKMVGFFLLLCRQNRANEAKLAWRVVSVSRFRGVEREPGRQIPLQFPRLEKGEYARLATTKTMVQIEAGKRALSVI